MNEGGPRRLHPISMVDTALKSLPGAIVGMIGAIGVLVQRNPGLALLIAAAILLCLLLGAAISWWRFSYDIRAHEIAIEQGVFSRQRRVIPFDRVRDVAIEQPLLARMVGTARVRIETGGGKEEEGLLDMIELDAAYALRDCVRTASRVAPSPQPGATQAPLAEPVIFAMSLARVAGSGLLNFSFVFIALLFGALQYLDNLGIVDLERLLTSGRARDVAGLLTVRTAAILLGLLALVGVLSGLARTFLRDFGFTLTVGESGLRRRCGLLTLSEVVIPSRRIEAARIETGWLGGWLGWHSLAFQTLGANEKHGGVQVAAPFARPEEIARILSAAGFPPPPDTPLQRPPMRALIRRCGPWVVSAAAAGVAVPFLPYAGWAALALLAFALFAALAWSREGHRAGELALHVRDGLFVRRLWIIPFEKLQTLSTRRGPLQNALDLASLVPDTAGAAAFGAARIADLGRREVDELMARLLADFYARRTEARRHLSVVEPEPGSA